MIWLGLTHGHPDSPNLFTSLFMLYSHRSLNRLKDLVAEHLDHLHYLNDILCLQIDALNAVLTDHLLNRLFIPLYIYSIGAPSSGANEASTPTSKLQVRAYSMPN